VLLFSFHIQADKDKQKQFRKRDTVRYNHVLAHVEGTASLKLCMTIKRDTLRLDVLCHLQVAVEDMEDDSGPQYAHKRSKAQIEQEQKQKIGTCLHLAFLCRFYPLVSLLISTRLRVRYCTCIYMCTMLLSKS
jgi:hypothetical protein